MYLVCVDADAATSVVYGGEVQSTRCIVKKTHTYISFGHGPDMQRSTDDSKIIKQLAIVVACQNTSLRTQGYYPDLQRHRLEHPRW